MKQMTNESNLKSELTSIGHSVLWKAKHENSNGKTAVVESPRHNRLSFM